MTREELELKKYAASELQGEFGCLLADTATTRIRIFRKRPAAEKDDRDRLRSSSPAQA